MRYRHSSFGLMVVHDMHYHQPERTDRPIYACITAWSLVTGTGRLPSRGLL